MNSDIKRIEKIKNLNKTIEDKLVLEFRNANGAYQKELRKLHQIEDNLMQLYMNPQKNSTVYEISNYNSWIDALKEKEKVQQQVVQRTLKLLEQVEKKLINQKIEVKKYDKILANKLMLHVKETNKKEQEELNEIALRLLT